MLDNHLNGHHEEDNDDDTGNFSSSPETPPDFPSESFYLSKEDEFEWVDRNAFYERKESTKGNSIPTPSSNSNPTSQRFSISSKTSKSSIIGLPKTQKTIPLRPNCKSSNNVRFFPKRSKSLAEKSPIPLSEPSSPKVSCIGRVRSKRGSRRQQRLRHSKSRKGSSSSVQETVKSGVETEKIGIKSEHIGFWGNLKAVFSSRYRKKKGGGGGGGDKKQTEETSAVMSKSDPRLSTASEPAGVCELNRFKSGRRTELFVVGDVEVAESDSVWDRRRLGPPKEVNCGRGDWENGGPATV